MKKTKELTLAAILTALSIIITYSPLKLVFPFFTLTIGAHIPTMIAIFISPWVTLMTIIGSCIGFFMTIPAPNSSIVVVRAATHIVFAFLGIKMLQSGKINIFLIIFITSVLHALCEGLAVYALTPLVIKNSDMSALYCAGIAALGTFIHHCIDAAISAPVILALMRAKIIQKRGKITNAQ